MLDLIALAMINAPQNGLLRLRLAEGAQYAVSLKVERDKPRTIGEIRQVVTAAKVNPGTMTFECRITGMTIDGKDRSNDLARMLTNPTVTFNWTDRAQRQGEMTALAFGKVNEDLMPLLQEAGLYLLRISSESRCPRNLLAWFDNGHWRLHKRNLHPQEPSKTLSRDRSYGHPVPCAGRSTRTDEDDR